ncbi:MAG: hypothetical protein MK142_10635 [Pseudomonadales bacterium]|nr:hypothetical protein [Pseudomonadales bacterium]
MISTVVLSADGVAYRLKFTTRAQCHVEEALGASIMDVAEGMGTTHGIRAACEILAASWNEGRGEKIGTVQEIVDVVGYAKAFGVITELVQSAFPTPPEGDDIDTTTLDTPPGK